MLFFSLRICSGILPLPLMCTSTNFQANLWNPFLHINFWSLQYTVNWNGILGISTYLWLPMTLYNADTTMNSSLWLPSHLLIKYSCIPISNCSSSNNFYQWIDYVCKSTAWGRHFEHKSELILDTISYNNSSIIWSL